MRLAALKRRVRELIDEMGKLADDLETMSGEIGKIEEWLPYRFSPGERCVDNGTLQCRTRPAETISRRHSWKHVAAQCADLLDDEEARDHWIAVIRRADNSIHSSNPPDQLIQSDYVQQAIGPVPDQ